MPALAEVVPTLVVAGTVDAAPPAAVGAAVVLGVAVVVLEVVALGAAVAVVGAAVVVLGAVGVVEAALVVLATGPCSRQCSCSRPP